MRTRVLLVALCGLLIGATAPPPIAASAPTGGVVLAAWPVVRPGVLPPEAAVPLEALQGPAADEAVSLGWDFFPGGSAEIGPRVRGRLEALVRLIPPGEPVGIVVWTSRNHPHARQLDLQGLAEKRAEALRAELERRGVRVGSVAARSFGLDRSRGVKQPDRGAVVIVPVGDLPRAR